MGVPGFGAAGVGRLAGADNYLVPGWGGYGGPGFWNRGGKRWAAGIRGTPGRILDGGRRARGPAWLMEQPGFYQRLFFWNGPLPFKKPACFVPLGGGGLFWRQRLPAPVTAAGEGTP